MKKRILSILLALCMLFCLVPTTAFAAGELPDVKLSVPTTFDKTVDLTKQNGELKIKDSKTYLIKGSADPNWYFQHRIKIDGKNNKPHIFLDGVRIQAPKDGPAIELYGGASACLYFIGNDSELIGADNFAALQKNKTDGYLRVLVQTGTKLTCEGGRYGAGIGGSKVGIKKFSQGHGMNLHFGSLATGIYGGEILAISGVYGAGIGGGGQGGVGEWIYVYSGKLTVRSVSEGAGIGGGQGGPGRFIYIKGGTVNAGSESGGAGIGSGDQDGQNKSEDAHHIEISGGTVEAWSNYAGAGIGGGRGGSGYDISITGGVVRAQGYYGAGIGGGMKGKSGNILIKDTTLTALALPLYPSSDYDYNYQPASAVGRGSKWVHWMTVMQDQEFAMTLEENIKIEASDGKSVRLSATGWQWRRSQREYERGWGTTTELLIGHVDLQRLSLPYAYNYGRVISELELRCEESTHDHEFGWAIRDGCHIWACVKCGARDPAAEMSKQNAKHIPGDWSNQKQLCTVCGHVLERDTKVPVLEGLKDGESYAVEDNIDGNPGAYTFTVSDPAASGEMSSGIKSVTINGVPQALGSFYSLPAPDGGNNDAGAEYTVVATDNAGNETTATVRTYRRHHYTITFDTVGGSEIAPITQDYGTAITTPADPTREGYTFIGWDKAIPTTMPAENVTITAKWEINQYTITFDTAGGSEIAPITQDYGTAITAPANPTKEGYTFIGWDKAIPATMPAENMTITAQWEINQYTITFDTAGGSTVAPITQDYGTNITAPADPTREGYTFIGWDKAIPTTMPAENMTIKAQWKINQYTITFDTAGGSAIAPITQDYGTVITAPEAPTREGYTFIGWDKAIPTAMPAENMTIKAQWKVNSYTITFDTAGGSEIAPITQDYGTAITAPEAPTREGYTFIGWDKEIPTTMPVENMTITARWKDIEKPTGEIKISENSWKACLNNITFGLFFKDTQTVTITAADNSGETVTVEYLLSDKELTKAELDGMTFTAYTAPFGIDPDNEYIIYVRLTDTAGNTDYICSDGIVLDGTSPVITGIEDGKIYCEAQTVTVGEKYVNTITVNGTEVTLDENNSFTLAPADGEQRIVVTDKAGNTAEMTVTVNDGHTYGEWVSNGNGTHTRQCTVDGYNGLETKDCSGGKATCAEKAVCKVCGKAYGELDPKNHTDLKYITAKAATEDAQGNIEYWYCGGCDKYYSDKDGINEIKKADTVMARIKGNFKSPRTGNVSDLALWISLLFVSGGAAIGTTAISRKKKYNR